MLRPTRELLEAGQLDLSRARLLCERLAVLDDPKAAAVQDRVLARAPGQTWAQLDASIRRGILAVDADGATERHRTAKKNRRSLRECVLSNAVTPLGRPPAARAGCVHEHRLGTRRR